MNIYYSPAYVQSDTDFDTTRKARWIADSYADDPRITFSPPRTLAADQLLSVHTAEYIQAVRTGLPDRLASSSGFLWDTHTFESVCASNGGVVDAVWDALAYKRHTGSLSSGLHHARAGNGNGFCTFNGLALAAHAIKDLRHRMLIIDLDAHCGGGTFSLVRDLPNVVHLDISINNFDQYEPTGLSTLNIAPNIDWYFYLLKLRLAQLRGTFDVVLYNAGVDVADLLTAKEIALREQIVFDWANGWKIPVAFVMAGGYTSDMTPDQLVNLHRLTIEQAMR